MFYVGHIQYVKLGKTYKMYFVHCSICNLVVRLIKYSYLFNILYLSTGRFRSYISIVLLQQVLDGVVSRLKRQGVLYNRETKSMSKFLILKARDAFRQNPPVNLQVIIINDLSFIKIHLLIVHLF